MNKEIKALRATDKMLGINKLYIVLREPLPLQKGCEVNIVGSIGDDGEVVVGTIQVTKSFNNFGYSPISGGIING